MAWFKLEEQKLLFIHIPKTGGRALATQLKKNRYFEKSNPGHKEICSIPNYKLYKSFCIVRNPYERMQSFYRHFYQEKNKDSHKKSFLEFVKNPPNTYHSKTQTHWVKCGNDILVDVIFKYCNYSKEIIPFLNENGVMIEYIEEYKPSDKSINCELTDEIKEIIYKKYKEDFDNFGYNK